MLHYRPFYLMCYTYFKCIFYLDGSIFYFTLYQYSLRNRLDSVNNTCLTNLHMVILTLNQYGTRMNQQTTYSPHDRSGSQPIWYLIDPATNQSCTWLIQLESDAGPVIQANGWLTFKGELRSGGLLFFTTQWTIVRTELANSMDILREPECKIVKNFDFP